MKTLNEDNLKQLGPGTYVLMLRLNREKAISIGKLGKFIFRSGYYAYVGSALGPGGLNGRLKRHLGGTGRPHWHVDYIRKETKPVLVWFAEVRKVREHAWADIMKKLKGSTAPVRGFGASDCACQTHLFYFKKRPSLDAFRKAIKNRFPKDGPVKSIWCPK